MTEPIDEEDTHFEQKIESLMSAAVAKMEIVHKDGVRWFEAPAPPQLHKHWVQSSGLIHEGTVRIERCPCGAIREEGESWMLLDPPRVAPRKKRLFRFK